MGAWGYHHFENDGAADFVIQLQEEGITKIYEAILRVVELPESEYVDLDDAQQALAAIEFVAAARGNASKDFPEESKRWMKEKYLADILEPDPDEAHKAYFNITEISQQAIERIRSNSELKELWEETENADAWKQELDELKERIT